MTYHTPVLLKEAVEQLRPRDGGLYVDCTLGGGGHAEAILQAAGPSGKLIGLDWDLEAQEINRERLGKYGERVQLLRANFAEVEQVLMSTGVTAVDGLMFDVGVSSRQFDEPSRGFSFQREGPLDMRMNRASGVTARDVLCNESVDELTRIFRVYGEERRARGIALRINRERALRPLETTLDLARVVEAELGPKRGNAIHPATRVFQALRIHVNRELENLQRGLAGAVNVLKSGGRLAVISFHSLEDRIVKQFFVQQSTGCVCPPAFAMCACGRKAILRVITRKPITATDAEIRENPRARSAKLRVVEKV
ncbi:MAG: 16S rRNA (cytosine(1402)-N(4))-methyltransferase RsmH [Verrucomicrobiota bacterium]